MKTRKCDKCFEKLQWHKCDTCNGNGDILGVHCDACAGYCGELICPNCNQQPGEEQPCPRCKGTGRVKNHFGPLPWDDCPECAGKENEG